MLRKAILVVGLAILVGAAGAVTTLLWQPPEEEPSLSANVGGSLSLVAPAFAQEGPKGSFPSSEAGISAYAQAGQEIDLEKAESLFRVVEAVTKDYVVGIVELLGHAEDMWPHAYIAKTGWILVYYPKSDPASKMVQWYGYERDVIRTTTLRDAVISLTRDLTLDVSKVDAGLQYYHFQYSQATKLLIVADTAEGSDEFSYTIPNDLTVFDASFSHRGEGIGGCYSSDASASWIDGEEIARSGKGTYVLCGALQGKHRTPGSAHRASIARDCGAWVGLALVFLYR